MTATPRDTRVIVFEAADYEGDWPPSNMTKALTWFREKLDSVPEEHRGSVTLSIDADTSYDSARVAMTIDYWRLQTQEEADEAAAHRAVREASRRETELKTLRVLRAKYPEET